MAQMSREFKSRSKTKVILESGLYVLIVLFLFVGNCLTLLVMMLNRRMRTIPNMFVASLAVSDLLIGVFSVAPLSIPILVTSHWPFNCQFQGYVVGMLAGASIHTLVLMAVNRYYRIVKPTKYRRYFTKKKTLIIILVSWLYSICAPLIFVLSGNKIVFLPSKFFCFFPIKKGAFVAYGIPLYIGIPTCVIVYCYFRIFTTVRNHNYSNFRLPGNPISSVNVEEVKVARTLLIIVVFFNLCWVPILTIDFVDKISQRYNFPSEVYVAYTFLATISSALNPLIYGVMNKSFRRNYLKVLRCTISRCRGTFGFMRNDECCGDVTIGRSKGVNGNCRGGVTSVSSILFTVITSLRNRRYWEKKYHSFGTNMYHLSIVLYNIKQLQLNNFSLILSRPSHFSK